MAADVVRTIRIFYSYAHKDLEFRNDIERHLATLRRLGYITTWYDREILPGTKWEYEIDAHLDSADIILPLVSSHFINSDYCWGKELTMALDRYNNRKTLVVPILLSPFDYKGTLFGDLQMLPTGGKAITSWANRDDALTDVAIGIRKLVEPLRAQKLQNESYTDYNKTNFDEALSACEEALRLDPDNPSLYVLKGDILFEQGHFADALSAYTEATERDADSKGHIGKARVYDYFARQSYEQAKAYELLAQRTKKENR